MNTTKPTEYVSDEDKDIIEKVCLELVAVDNETDDDAALAANTNFSEVVTPEAVLALLQEIADLRR
jgi:hypothetical protein